jgi:hypothetical protein
MGIRQPQAVTVQMSGILSKQGMLSLGDQSISVRSQCTAEHELDWHFCMVLCAQVRYGVLNAGHYGAPQSRTRTFVWAAAPHEKLPDWPQPQHTFR